MVSFSEAVQESGRLALCSLFAGNEAVNALISPIAGDSLGLYPLTSGLRRKLCSDDPANDPEYEPPFEGGQCAGTTYQINWTQIRPGLPDFPDSNQRVGPLTLSRALDPGDTSVGCAPGTTFQRYTMLSGGSPLGLTSGCGVSIADLTVSPLFGGSDACGDPPPPPPGPPADVVYEGDDITYNIDESTEITVPISFVFSPAYIDLDGSINIPVRFDAGGIEFNGTVEISPEFNFEFSPGGAGGGGGTVDDPDGIGEPGIPSEPVEDPDENTLPIIGVLVYSDIDPDGDPSGILFPDGPNIYVPRLASVTFAIKTADSIGWTPDQDVKNLECYVPCPALQGAIAVRVSPMRGVTSRFTAVRGRILTPES